MMTRTVAAMTLLLMIGGLLVPGCGPSNQEKVRKSQESVVAVGPAATPQPQANNAKDSSAKPKPAPRLSDKKSSVPENADPKTVYIVNSVGSPMDVTAKNGLIPENKYEVTFADPTTKSSNYSVESTGTSALSQSLIGRGTPKSGFTLPKGFTEFKPTGYDTSGLPLRIVCTKTGKQLALVPGGTSVVGTDHGPEECQPAFNVTLESFYMEVLEVTVDDYEKYRNEFREKKKPLPPAPSNPDAKSDFPALGVSWAGAQGYVRWTGLELPTEAEFEKAARGPKGQRTPWGDGKPLWGVRKLTRTGAYRDDTSPYGILDLAGNALEWCTDLYSPTSHTEAATVALKETLKNWQGPKKVREMNLRVVKGGGDDWSSWNRAGMDMQKVHPEVGFRGVLRLTSDSKDSKEPKSGTGSKKGSDDTKKSEKGF